MDIRESLAKILNHNVALGNLFYGVLLDEHPDVQEYFRGVDLRHQATVLTMALATIEHHYSNCYPVTGLYLKHLGHKHHLKGVPANLYPKFCDALLATLRGFHGEEWSADLEAEWRDALDLATETMLAGYEEPCPV